MRFRPNYLLTALLVAGSSFLSACGGGGGGGELAADGAPTSASAQGQASPNPAAPEIAAVTAGSKIAYPFGSRLAPYVAGITPTVSTQATQDELIRKQYDNWKAKIVQARCGGYVVTFNSTYATVSEGAGYGMLLSVQMAGHDSQAKDLFDGLFRVARSHPATGTQYPALMDWRVNADCSPGGGGGWNAMDGDLDIAMALLMADKQWGSSGTVNYKAEALRTIAALKAYNMSPVAHTKGLPNSANNRTSDFMITHFKAFKRATNDAFWDAASDRAFDLLDMLQAKYSPDTGLIPDFVIDVASNPAPSTGYIADGNAFEGFYYWNASRIPWRLAADYVTSGDERSKKVTSKMIDFFQKTSGGNPAKIKSGYKLDGSSTGNGDFASPAFIGPATAGAMVDAKFQPFLNSLWSYSGDNLSTSYYDSELQLLSLIVASGNWWTP